MSQMADRTTSPPVQANEPSASSAKPPLDFLDLAARIAVRISREGKAA